MAQVMAQSKKLPEISSLKIAQKLKYFTKKVQNWPFLPFEKWFIALKTKNFAHFKKQPKISPFSLATFLKKNFAKAHKKQPKWRNFATSGHTVVNLCFGLSCFNNFLSTPSPGKGRVSQIFSSFFLFTRGSVDEKSYYRPKLSRPRMQLPLIPERSQRTNANFHYFKKPTFVRIARGRFDDFQNSLN